MLLNVGPIFETEGAKLPFSYEFPSEEPLIPGNIALSGSVFNKTGVVRLEASAEFTVETACARCGAPIRRDERLPLTHLLLRHARNEDQDLYIVLDSSTLDLDALASEDVILSLPQRYLCREDCKGLCPMCGADLNLGACGCEKPKDPRLEALSRLLNG